MDMLNSRLPFKTSLTLLAGTLIGLDQTRLSDHPGLIRRIARAHQFLDQRLSLGVIRIVLNDKQCGLHYMNYQSGVHVMLRSIFSNTPEFLMRYRAD